MHDEVIILTKHPTPGCVKTRLIGRLSPLEAATLYRACVEMTFSVARPLMERGVRVTVALSPDRAQLGALLPPGFRVVPQGEGDLGKRLARCVDRSLEEGARSVVVIGCDCPYLQTSLLEEAVTILFESGRAVIGPAVDGGYYLLGIQRHVPGLFEGIDWSTDRVGAQTTDRLVKAGCDVHKLPALGDLDEYDDLLKFAEATPGSDAEAALQAFVRSLIRRGTRP